MRGYAESTRRPSLAARNSTETQTGAARFTRATDDGDWELVSVTVEGFHRPYLLKASEEASIRSPRTRRIRDPRSFGNIPPVGPG